MKVGILTFQYAINYGAVLQMYSLKNVIEKEGHDVEIINYVPSGYKRSRLKSIFRMSGIKSKKIGIHDIKDILSRIIINLRYQNSIFDVFDNFLIKFFSLSARTDDSNWQEIVEKYDCVIVGSDQVWNPTNQKGDVYFLNLPETKNMPMKIAYAADSTNESVQQDSLERLRKALDSFKGISVRNEHTQSFVNKITGQIPSIVADPVILSDFSEFCGQPPFTDEKYALVYVLGKGISGGHSAVVSDIRKKYGDIKIYQIVMMKQNEFALLDGVERRFYDCAPEEWVNLIYNAEFIYTDSFHCMLFAMKFHKPFLSYYADENRAPRLLALQKQYSLGNRIVSSVDEMRANKSLDFEIDYNEIDRVFSMQRKNSTLFLKKHIGGSVEKNGEIGQ